jgi:hypothetical protein
MVSKYPRLSTASFGNASSAYAKCGHDILAPPSPEIGQEQSYYVISAAEDIVQY